MGDKNASTGTFELFDRATVAALDRADRAMRCLKDL